MLTGELPDCVCGARNWIPKGAQLGGIINCQWFICSNSDCSRPALLLQHQAGCILLQPAGDLRKIDEIKLNEWVNLILLPLWSDFADRRRKVQEQIEQVYWDQLSDQLGVARGTKWDDIPSNNREKWQSSWDELYRKDEYRNPEGFREQPIPPNLSAYQMVAKMFTLEGEWKPVDEDVSANVTPIT